jgi:hypothetical protein
MVKKGFPRGAAPLCLIRECPSRPRPSLCGEGGCVFASGGGKAQNRSSSSPSLVSHVPIAAVMRRSILLAVALMVVMLAGCAHIARYYKHMPRALQLVAWRYQAGGTTHRSIKL